MRQRPLQGAPVEAQRRRSGSRPRSSLADLEKSGADHRVDDQGDKQGGGQGDQQGDRQILHEFAHDPRPEEHREEGAEGGQRRADHRPADLGDGIAGGLHPPLPFLHVAVDVLDDDDGVVDQHPQGEDQAEENHHVQRDPQRLQDDEGDQHREGDRQGDKEAVAQAEEEKEHPDDQDQAGEDVVLQLR